MFDISFIELLVIFVVALLVLGPEKLPGAVRTAALWLGRAKRSFSKVKSEIEQQLNTDDIRRQLHNESIMADIEKARKNADNLVKETRDSLNRTRDDVNRTISMTDQPAQPVVSSSAIEGVPTGADTWPDQTPDTVPSVTATPAPATSPAPAHDALKTDVSAPTTDPMPSNDSDPSPEEPSEQPTTPEQPPAPDIYNSPPTGRVTMTGRKLVPAARTDQADSSGQKD